MEDLSRAHTETFTEGYATAGPPSDPKPDYYWVCPECFDDFRVLLEFKLTAGTNPSDD